MTTVGDWGYWPAMNRIRELRDLAGLTAEDLAARMGSNAKQIYRLERGERRLTTKWMEQIAKALHCAPTDLISATSSADGDDEVAPFEPTGASAQVLNTLKGLGFTAYSVHGDSVAEAGIKTGDVITVRHLDNRLEGVKPLDVLLVGNYIFDSPIIPG